MHNSHDNLPSLSARSRVPNKLMVTEDGLGLMKTLRSEEPSRAEHNGSALSTNFSRRSVQLSENHSSSSRLVYALYNSLKEPAPQFIQIGGSPTGKKYGSSPNKRERPENTEEASFADMSHNLSIAGPSKSRIVGASQQLLVQECKKDNIVEFDNILEQSRASPSNQRIQNEGNMPSRHAYYPSPSNRHNQSFAAFAGRSMRNNTQHTHSTSLGRHSISVDSSGKRGERLVLQEKYKKLQHKTASHPYAQRQIQMALGDMERLDKIIHTDQSTHELFRYLTEKGQLDAALNNPFRAKHNGCDLVRIGDFDLGQIDIDQEVLQQLIANRFSGAEKKYATLSNTVRRFKQHNIDFSHRLPRHKLFEQNNNFFVTSEAHKTAEDMRSTTQEVLQHSEHERTEEKLFKIKTWRVEKNKSERRSDQAPHFQAKSHKFMKPEEMGLNMDNYMKMGSKRRVVDGLAHQASLNPD